MSSYVSIIGNDNTFITSSLFLFTDTTRYLFNVGECIQRICTEYKIKLAKVKHIFLTRIHIKTIGGIPGNWNYNNQIIITIFIS